MNINRIKLAAHCGLPILLIFILFGLSLLTSCEPPEPICTEASSTYWLIKNSTSDSLRYKIYYHNSPAIERVGKIGKTTIFSYRKISGDNFDPLFSEGIDSIEVISDLSILRTWRSSEAEKSGKQFFNARFWQREKDEFYHACSFHTSKNWVFEITSDDINK